jgi:sortase A
MWRTDELALCRTGVVLYAIEFMQQSTDHQEPVSMPPDQYSLGETTEEHSFGEVIELPTPRTRKRRWVRYSRQPVFKRRRRVACLVLVLLLLLAVGGLLFLSNPDWMDSEPLERVVSPVAGEAPEVIAEDPTAEEEAAKGKASEEEAWGEEAAEEEESIAVPDDPTLYLTVPRLGLYGHTVRDDDSEEALDLGAIKLPSTEFPWQKGDKNTYIACHRLGWPDTESHNQCLNLPLVQKGDKIVLEDAKGMVYEYRVVETLTAEPGDTWVTNPVAGKDMVSLQTCVEAPDDFLTLGPNWATRFVVRAERVEEGQGDGFRRTVEDSVAAYAGFLLHTPSLSSYYGRALETAKRATVLLWNVGTVFITEALLKLNSLTLLSNSPYPFVQASV